MAITPFKTFAAGESLTASDLNSSFSAIINNALQLISPLTGNLDVDGNSLIMDSDADSSIRSAADDQITMKLNNADLFVWSGSTASVVNGLTTTAAATGNPPSIAATGSDTNIGVTVAAKGTGVITLDGGVAMKVGADAASASSLPVNAAGTFFDVTGTTSVTSLAAKGVGAISVLQFDGALTLTHHATDLVLPNAQDVVTEAGYVAAFYEYAAGDVRLLFDNRRAYTTAPYTTTGGSTAEFTGIPSWARHITIIISSMSSSGLQDFMCQLGTASGYETSGYSSGVWWDSAGVGATSTSGFILTTGTNNTYTMRGAIELYRTGTNQWTSHGQLAHMGVPDFVQGTGTKSLADTLTKLKVFLSSDTFDAMHIALRISP